ncbi:MULTISPECIES: phosphotransferase [Actinomadura]|uniref:Phosphotransferase n=1 Tax=Actinomadura yumaensis TaxID=111807 RepID=A0ABW2C8X8_9ACTN|nr:phosphotransferase [Actinomadura sp. J1-007]MWK34005.1 phosphotransferase [Actinomadura sp. J1-007]
MTTTGHVRARVGQRNVLVPLGSRRAALAGVALLTRSRAPALACQWLLYGAVAAAGPRAVPGARVRWDPPGGRARWEELAAQLGPFDHLALYERPQRSRTGLAAVLLRAGRPTGFLKLREDAGALEREHRALSAFPDGRAAGFRVPRVLGRGGAAGWHWMLIEPMPSRPAHPPRRPGVASLVGAIQRRLAPALPRPPGVPPHWRPMHGDLTVWNLRRCGTGRPWLIDWEDAGWAPPGADRLYYEATRSVVFGTAPPATAPREAAEFWLGRVAPRPSTDGDAPFNAALSAVLRDLARDGRRPAP